MPKAPQQGARKHMEKRPMVEVPEDVHQSLKVYAALHRTQVKALVEEALRTHLKKLEKKG
jgi:predicted HicB family RNase H-like nuclease